MALTVSAKAGSALEQPRAGRGRSQRRLRRFRRRVVRQCADDEERT